MNTQDIISSLSRDLGIESLPKDKQKQILEEFSETIFQSAIVVALEKVSEEKLEEFQKENTNNDPAKLVKFLEDNVPDFGEIMTEEAQKQVAELKSLVKQLS
jgi:hypothetical protein